MAVKDFYPDNEPMFYQISEQKTEDEVQAERNITLLVLFTLMLLAVGIPMLVNLGKALFEVQAIIY